MKPYLSCWSYGYHGKDDDFVKDLYKLSAHLLLVNYGEVHLITDKEGKERLKNIPFTSVNTSLEILPKNLKVLWSLGKVLAYKIISEKGEPFFHIDNDVFLFKKLPEEIFNKEVITQHKEEDAHYFYEVNSFTENIPNKFYLEKEKVSYAHNMSIFGGTNIEFINFYANEALKLALDKQNINFFQKTNFNKSFTPPCIVEQYYMSLLANKKNVKVSTIFEDLRDREISQKLGFTHLWSGKFFETEKLHLDIKNIIYHLNIK
jgi:hypothetical protein